MLEVRDLYFAHSSPRKVVLHGVSFTVNRGIVTAILGPNGSGKTTLFKCLTGIWNTYSGRVTADGKDVSNLSITEKAKIFAIVPQDHVPPFPYTVLEVVLMGRAPYVSPFSLPSSRDYEIAEKTLRTLGITSLKDRPYTGISGGERQLVLVARALAQEAPCLLLDEPTAHLDFRHQVLVLTTLRRLVVERNLLALVTLHDPNLALLFADHVVLMDKGKVITQGLPEEVITEENISAIYRVNCSVYVFNGQRFLCPQVER